MTNRVVFQLVAMLIGVSCAACHSEGGAFDPIGRWTSNEGYEVTLRKDSTYRFCDHEVCSEGKVERPGGGFGVTLVGFFKKENSARLASELRRLYEGYTENFGEDGNLNFTANSDVGGASASEFCGYKPCVLFGNLETGPNLAFTKTDS